jgi:type I restriction enzyme, R subunit
LVSVTAVTGVWDELRTVGFPPRLAKARIPGQPHYAGRSQVHEQLAEMQKIIDAERNDLFDLAYVAYALSPLT